MPFIKSISELSHQSLRETWWNASQMYVDLNDFYQSSILSVLDDCGFEIGSKHISGGNFLSNVDMSIECKPMQSLLKDETWEKIANHFYLGLYLDEEKSNCMEFYSWLWLPEGFQRDYFHKSGKTKQLKSALENKGWNLEYIDDKWAIYRLKPVEEIDFSKPTWKRDLKRFYEDSLSQISETYLKTDNWLE